MLCFGLPEVEQDGKTFLSDTAPWKTVYSCFCRWRDDGTLLRIFQSLNEDADMENLSLDSTVIKAHPHSAGAKKGL